MLAIKKKFHFNQNYKIRDLLKFVLSETSVTKYLARNILFFKRFFCNESFYKNNNVIVLMFPTETLIEFFNLWPLNQWISSLVGLVVLYWYTTKLYNKRLSIKCNTELSISLRIYMIFSDLIINLVVGLFYMNHRETALGQLMVQCPIAISPLIYIIELVIVIYYYEIYKKAK